jgi:Tol biopolymer transport system component
MMLLCFSERRRPMHIPMWTILAFLMTATVTCAHGDTARKTGNSTNEELQLRNITQLTFEGDNGEAYFSSDGKKLVFQSNLGGFGCDKIWIMNVDGSEKHMVSPDHGAHTCSFFFPGGQRIVFASTSHIPGACPPKKDLPGGYVWPLYPYDIFTAKIDGSDLRKITDNPKYDAEPVISSDGKKIVFGSQRDGDFDVYVMNSDGSNVKRLTEQYGYDGGPWFSPDGKKIVWRAWYPETEEERTKWKDCMDRDYIMALPLDLWIMDADGSNKKRILRNKATNWAPSWHPDGKRIVFSSNMDDWHEDIKKYGHNFELYMINTDGTGLKRLTYNSVFDSFPMFSPDGKKLSFASNRNPQRPRATDIFIVDWVE